jgi:LysM domain
MDQPIWQRTRQRRTQRLALAAQALLFCLAAGLGANNLTAQEVTGSGPVKVEPHSSRWDYPKEINVPEGSKLHIVSKGDTLWDLANNYLGNPYAWPQIWELNQWIKDPHWIYPGDPLIIDLSKGVAGPVPDAVGNLKPGRINPNALRIPEMAYSFQDFIQLPYLVPEGADAYYKNQGAFKLVSNRRDDRFILGEGETVYMNGGSEQGVKQGDRFLAVRTATKKFKPLGRKKVAGDVVQNLGIVRVTVVNAKTAVGVVEKAMDGLEVGQHLVRFTEPAYFPMELRKDIADPIAMKDPVATVIYAREHREHTANGEMLIVDRGSEDGLKVGDVLLAARTRTLLPAGKKSEAETTTHYLGQVVVVRLGDRNATVRVLRSTEEIVSGDQLTR